MTSFAVAGLVRSADSLAVLAGAGGNSAATWTSVGFAGSLASLPAPALLGSVLSTAPRALATLADTAGFARIGVAADATMAVGAGAASSSSSSRARPKSLANGL